MAIASTSLVYSHMHADQLLGHSVTVILLGVHERISDTHLTANSGFLNLLLPGDIILAHRGLGIEGDVARMLASLKIPAFTCGY